MNKLNQLQTPTQKIQQLNYYLSVIVDELRKPLNLIDLVKVQSFFGMVSNVYAECVPYFECFDTAYQMQAWATANERFNDELMNAYQNQIDDMELDKTLTMYADMMSRLITDILLSILAELSCNYE